jgi:hypothetical protein
MSFSTNIQLEKPAQKTLRYDTPLNENFDKIDSGFTCWADTDEPGTAGNYDEIVLTEGILWRDLTTHLLKVRNGSSAWEAIHTHTIANYQTNVVAPGAAPTDSYYQYAYDQVAGNSCPHFKTELGTIIKLYQQAHVADINTTVIASLTNAFGTADGTLEDIGATNTGDVSGAIKNNFKECTTEIANLKTVIDDLRTKFNTILTYKENLGLHASA